jgi:hypothetical protein
MKRETTGANEPAPSLSSDESQMYYNSIIAGYPRGLFDLDGWLNVEIPDGVCRSKFIWEIRCFKVSSQKSSGKSLFAI